MEEMKDMKIEKGKTYTYEQLKEIYKKALLKTLNNPVGDEEKDAKFLFTMMLSGTVILQTMEDNLFEKEEE